MRASAWVGAGAWLRHPLMASATAGWRAGLSGFWILAAAWKWDIAARAWLTLAMDIPSDIRWPRWSAIASGAAGKAQ